MAGALAVAVPPIVRAGGAADNPRWPKTFIAGQSFEMSDHAIHAEGAIGDKPCKLFVACVLEKGQPPVIPAK
jgi:hypothetical protein